MNVGDGVLFKYICNDRSLMYDCLYKVFHFSIVWSVMCNKSGGNKMVVVYFTRQRQRELFSFIIDANNTTFTVNSWGLRKSILPENENGLALIEEKSHTVWALQKAVHDKGQKMFTNVVCMKRKSLVHCCC